MAQFVIIKMEEGLFSKDASVLVILVVPLTRTQIYLQRTFYLFTESDMLVYLGICSDRNQFFHV